jgi:methionyl-tRNA synthetase
MIAIYLKPIVPAFVSRVEHLFLEPPYVWKDVHKTLGPHSIKTYEHLMTRIDPEKVKAMVEDSKAPSPEAPLKTAPHSEFLDIETFSKMDLRVAQVLEAEEIKEADKLIRLKVSLGDLGERQIIAGIKSAYKAETLKGRKILVVANLAPRKMKFGVSEGMVLAAGNESGLFVLSPDDGAKAGDKVK